MLIWFFVSNDNNIDLSDNLFSVLNQRQIPHSIYANPLDAICAVYSSNSRNVIACRLKLLENVTRVSNKLHSSAYDIIDMREVSTTLHKFALSHAERVLLNERKAGREPDKKYWNALQIKLDWMNKSITDYDLYLAQKKISAVEDNLLTSTFYAYNSVFDALYSSPILAAHLTAEDASKAETYEAMMQRGLDDINNYIDIISKVISDYNKELEEMLEEDFKKCHL